MSRGADEKREYITLPPIQSLNNIRRSGNRISKELTLSSQISGTRARTSRQVHSFNHWPTKVPVQQGADKSNQPNYLLGIKNTHFCSLLYFVRKL